MNHQLWAFVALDLAQQRDEAANRRRRGPLDQDRASSSPGLLRRSLAHGLAGVSRAVAAIVRKLDSCIADDLGRSLAPTE